MVSSVNKLIVNNVLQSLQVFPDLSTINTYYWLSSNPAPAISGLFNLRDVCDEAGSATAERVYNLKQGTITIKAVSSTDHWVCDLIVKYNSNICLSLMQTPVAKNHGSSSYPYYLILCVGFDSSDSLYKPVAFQANTDSSGIINGGWIVGAVQSGWSGYNETDFNKLISGVAVSQDPYQTAPDSTPDGGYGDYNYDGDDIPVPALPSWSIVDSGFVTLYKPSISQIKALAQYLWTGIFDLATYKKIFADPMDCIISLSRVPINAPATGSQVLTVGNISTGLTFDVLSQQFVEIKFLTKNIGLRANGFLDFAPYVKVQIYLPFIGMRALSIDDIAGKDLKLTYQIDLFTGACTAYLECKVINSDGNDVTSVLYQYSGNVLANIPITQANYDSFINSVITAAAKTGSALISGGAAAAAGAAISSGINVAANIKPDVERSGNMTATSGFLGVKKPYLIVTYPNVCKPANRDKTVSIPSFIGLGIQEDNTNLKLSNFKGLTILHKINVKNIPCTEIERQMIENQLTTEGVIL